MGVKGARRYSDKMNRWLKRKMRLLNYIGPEEAQTLLGMFNETFPDTPRTFSGLTSHLRALKGSFKIPTQIFFPRVEKKDAIVRFNPTPDPVHEIPTTGGKIFKLLNKVKSLVVEQGAKLVQAENELKKLGDVKAFLDLYADSGGK